MQWTGVSQLSAERAAVAVAAALLASTGWLAKREPSRGRRWLLGLGTALIFCIVISRIWSSDAPIWPVLLAGLGFLYLWWLGILMFDLTFVWHRYIRRSVAIDSLRQWRHGKDAEPNPMLGLGARRPPALTCAP
jgi:hypothetical protein